jgi:hypothetical protein
VRIEIDRSKLIATLLGMESNPAPSLCGSKQDSQILTGDFQILRR